MKMGWWVFMALLTVQIVLIHFMAEEFLAGHYEHFIYYIFSLGFMFVISIVTYFFFRKADQVLD